MRVLKFGGTSVGSVENINKMLHITAEASKSEKIIVVVSALGGITDMLLEAGTQASHKEKYVDTFNAIRQKHIDFTKALVPKNKAALEEIDGCLDDLDQLLQGIYLINELSPKTIDKLAAFGEIMSSTLITHAMQSKGLEAVRKDSRDVITTNDNHTRAAIEYTATNNQLEYYFSRAQQQVTVMPGFIASTSNGEVTTLGRGGSDFTAAIVAAALTVKQLEIYTDVSGMFTVNPKMVKQARPIDSISYHQAMDRQQATQLQTSRGRYSVA